MAAHRHAPRDCPVCGSRLELTRLSCPDCHTELSGGFEACQYCSLGSEDRDLLRVFLASRGNMKELERHLGVSYPTARARFDSLLGRVGIETPSTDGGKASTQDAPAPNADDASLDVLDALARGDINVEEATRRL